MSSSPPAQPNHPPPDREGVRPGLFRAALLLMLLVIAGAIVFIRPRPVTREEHETKMAAAVPPVQHPASHASAIVPQTGPNSLLPAVSDLATAQLIAQLLDESQPLNVRRRAARSLGRLGSDEALAALRIALGNGPTYLKAAVAESFGECTNAQAPALLAELTGAQDEIVARGAVRGLALRGDTESVDRLGTILMDAGQPASVRTEAALALGEVKLPSAMEVLTRAAADIRDGDLLEYVMEGLGKRPLAETEGFFHNYLASESVATESKISAIEALGNAEGDVAPFLLSFLGDPNPDIRAAVAWALNSVDLGDNGARLADVLRQERNATVRTRLYQALEIGGEEYARLLLPRIQDESDVNARLAGFEYLAGTLRSAADPGVRAFFTQTAVPELRDTALQSADLQARLASVIALGRAGVPEAHSALEEISRQSVDPKVIAAAQSALKRPASK